MGELIPTYEELLLTAFHLFYEKYNKKVPTSVGWAPGNVNLIGEHTDYNNGYVFPMALPLITLVIGAENYTTLIKVATDANIEGEASVSFKIPDEVALFPGEPEWANYVKGTVNFFQGATVPGFNALIVSSIPIKAGLGSSAALVVAIYNFLEELTGVKTQDLILKAVLCQRVEHRFAQHPCGIMDQFMAIFSKKGYTLLLDCMNLEFNYVALGDPEIKILIINSNYRDETINLIYSLRRNQCKLASKQMNVLSLRDSSMTDLIKNRLNMEDNTYRVARHVITENNRTVMMAQALKLKDYTACGLILLQSHNSLRDDYEVSCQVTDELVEITMDADGVYGARMVGAGFGGCVLAFVKADDVDSVIHFIKNKFMGNATFYSVDACGSNYDFYPMLHNLQDRKLMKK